MKENMGKPWALTQGQAALIAAFALLINIIVAGIASMGILPGIIGNGDVATAISNILSSEPQFRVAICLLTVNVIADIVAFWALYYFLKPAGPNVSLLSLLFGVLYAAVSLAGTNNLSDLLHMIHYTASGAVVGPDAVQVHAATAIHAFQWAWQAGMVMFGVHLALRGSLLIKAGYMKRWLGIVVLMTGAGYLVDGFGQILISGYDSAVITSYIGWFEALLVIWLFAKGFTERKNSQNSNGRTP